MGSGDDDILWMIKSGRGPWQSVTKEEWVRTERAAGFHNTLGQPNEPGTASFSGQEDRGGEELQGTQVYVKFFGDDSYAHEPELREAIVEALKARNLELANATPPRRYTDAYDIGHGTPGP